MHHPSAVAITGQADDAPMVIEQLIKTVLESALLREGGDPFELTDLDFAAGA